MTQEVPWGHLPAFLGRSSQPDLGRLFHGPSAIAQVSPPACALLSGFSQRLDGPARGQYPFKTADGACSTFVFLFAFRISWGLGSAAVQIGTVSHSTVYTLCNHYLGSLLSH